MRIAKLGRCSSRLLSRGRCVSPRHIMRPEVTETPERLKQLTDLGELGEG